MFKVPFTWALKWRIYKLSQACSSRLMHFSSLMESILEPFSQNNILRDEPSPLSVCLSCHHQFSRSYRASLSHLSSKYFVLFCFSVNGIVEFIVHNISVQYLFFFLFFNQAKSRSGSPPPVQALTKWVPRPGPMDRKVGLFQLYTSNHTGSCNKLTSWPFVCWCNVHEYFCRD